MIELGVDQHKRFSQVAALDTQTGKIEHRRLEHDDPQAIRSYMASLGPQVRASLETTGNWYWLADLLEEEGAQVQLANTLETRRLLKARAKNDRLDAQALAVLSHQGLLPQVYLPTKAQRDQREVHRFRIRLLGLQTQVRNIVHSILSKLNVPTPFTDMFGRSGRSYLDRLALREPYAGQLRSALRVLDAIAPEVLRAKQQIVHRLKGEPLADLLQSAPGIGQLTAYLILSEVGPIERFRSQKQFARYCCLTPGTWRSARRSRDVPVGRHGNLYLKAAFGSAAVTAIRTDATMAGYYRRTAARKGKQTARMATARRLAICVYQMLTRRQRYRPAAQQIRHTGKPHLCPGQHS
ncbi:IS110 family transposase [bacterium]|nr:IS110 family transposase [bacterium]